MKKISADMQAAIDSLGASKRRPLGKFSPWAWGLEPVRGCNLKCWHCPARLLPDNVYKYMTKEVWTATWKIISELTPYGRVEMAHTGEPTLHPDLLEFVKIARVISPHSQIQVTTNGTQLISRKISYKKLFDAGVNVVYVDMYAPVKQHLKLAKASGYKFYKYYEEEKDAISCWTYHDDPDLKLIALSQIPDNWPSRKLKKGGLGTFLNHIDFEVAQRFGIRPVENAPHRRCSQPMKYVMIANSGDYMMCCMDALYESKVTGNVLQGTKGFMKFWLGKYMQRTRQILRSKRRKNHPLCKRCAICYARCDVLFWKKDMLNYYWNGREYRPMKQLI